MPAAKLLPRKNKEPEKERRQKTKKGRKKEIQRERTGPWSKVFEVKDR